MRVRTFVTTSQAEKVLCNFSYATQDRKEPMRNSTPAKRASAADLVVWRLDFAFALHYERELPLTCRPLKSKGTPMGKTAKP